jgi:hypothetical protein
MFSEKVYATVRDMYPNREDSTGGKRKRDGTKAISTSKKQASKFSIPPHSLNQIEEY